MKELPSAVDPYPDPGQPNLVPMGLVWQKKGDYILTEEGWWICVKEGYPVYPKLQNRAVWESCDAPI